MSIALPPPRHASFDHVIVGSGAAGATVARVLADTGRSVAVVEEGGEVTTESFSERAFDAFGTLYRDMGMQVAAGRSPMLVLQGACVGGSTVVNSAIVRRMPEEVWGVWRHEHGLGDALPFAALEASWERIEHELSVSPTPQEVWGGNNTAMDDARRSLGVAGGAIPRNVVGCRGSARCQLGCPHGAKQSMALTYLPYARRRGVRVFARARADRVVWDGDRAAGVVGDGFRLEARRGVIVAASAIQTPLLLARSGVRSPHLGRHLQAHPGLEVAAVFDRPVRMWWGATQGYEIDEYRASDRAKIETVALPPELHFAALAGVGRRWVAAMAESEHVAVWAIALRAFAQGRVRERFGATNIGFDLEARDMENLKRAIRHTADLFFAAGARYVLPGIRGLPERIGPEDVALLDGAPSDPTAYTFILSHLFGTARMSVRAEDGVVGADFTVHRHRGLTVVDSSVFPTNLGVNPQHTIMAVAMHAAERIAEET